MRLRQLNLIRYGKFTDRVLDFGPANADSDVTVVFGPNEAGKSTAFSAWLDLLFGLPNQTPYAFRNKRIELMIGATLDTDQGSLTLNRTGKRQGSLTDENGRVVDEHRLAAVLHGLDRDAYRTRFSLDDAILRKGGEDIASAKGDLGQLLHSGTSGLAGLSDVLDGVARDVETFHKKGGRATVLARHKKDLTEIEMQLKEARVEMRGFDALRAEQAAANADLDGLAGELRAAQQTVSAAQRVAKRMTQAGELARLDQELSQFTGGPDLPTGAERRVASALARRSEAQIRKEQAETDKTLAQTALAALGTDPDGLLVSQTFQAVEGAQFDDGNPLMSRVQTAAADLPKRRQERAALDVQAAVLAQRLAGQDANPEDLQLSQGVLSDLTTKSDALVTLRQRVSDLDQSCHDAEARLGPQVMVPKGLEQIKDAIDAVQRMANTPAQHSQTAHDLRLQADQAAIGLPPDWKTYVAAGLPPIRRVTELAQGLDRQQIAAANAAANLKDQEAQLTKRQISLDAIIQGQGFVTLEAQLASRKARNSAWQDHRQSLSGSSADEFEHAMRSDDDVSARFAATADHRAELAQAQLSVKEQQTKTEQARTTAHDAQTRLTKVAAQVAVITEALALSPDVSPSGLDERHQTLVRASELDLAAKAQEKTAHHHQMALSQALDHLGDVIRDAGFEPETGSPDQIVTQACRIRDQMQTQTNDALAWVKASQGFEQQKTTRDQVAGLLAKNEKAFQHIIAQHWCHTWSDSVFRNHRPDLLALDQILHKRIEIDQRVARMEAAIEAFDALVAPVLSILECNADTPALDVLAKMRARTRQVTELCSDVTTQEAALARATKELQDCDHSLRAAQAEIDLVFDGQDASQDMPDAVLTRLLQRDAVRAQIKAAKRDYDRLGDGVDPALLAFETNQAGPERVAFVQDQLEQLQMRREAALRRAGQADQAVQQALTSTGGAALDQKRATLLAELREQARSAAVQAFGLMAARGALRRFRQERRGEMLQATERAFATLTHGVWPRLETQSTGTGERLVAVRDETFVAADAMSTGTRGQLYLALRIAGHADFVRDNGPLPFITDDVHETFDDDRATAALELAGEMGRLGQAILFTHHAHLVELARTAIPGVNIVRL